MSCMDNALKDRIARARYLLKTAKHSAMATVNADGSPHNTPFFFIREQNIKNIFWCSSPESLHSKNIERTGQLFLVVYDSSEGGGVYIKAEHGHELSGRELDYGLKVHNEARAREGKQLLHTENYSGSSPQRMYGAKPIAFWVNIAKRDENGHKKLWFGFLLSPDLLLTVGLYLLTLRSMVGR